MKDGTHGKNIPCVSCSVYNHNLEIAGYNNSSAATSLSPFSSPTTTLTSTYINRGEAVGIKCSGPGQTGHSVLAISQGGI